MSIPLSRAWSPLALEIMSGRLPCAAGARLARAFASFPIGSDRPKSLPALATALPASEVRKNLRRDNSSMGRPPRCAEGNIHQLRHFGVRRIAAAFLPTSLTTISSVVHLAGRCRVSREFAFPARDDDTGDTITENGDGRSSHIHELIDCEEKK